MSILGLGGCASSSASEGYTDNNVAQFKEYISNPDVQLVDVRTPEEFAEGHIAGATNIDYYAPDFVSKCELNLDKSWPIAIYCRSGHRSGLAASALQKAGYNVTNLEGGILAWTAQGEPTIK